MATVTLGGTPFHTSGELPAVGSRAPDFVLVGKDLGELTLEKFAGKKKILNIFPSVDTPTCATSVRTFNKEASSLPNAVVVCISADLPFAQARFCGAEGLENVVTASLMRGHDFAKHYGVLMTDGPLAGICARAVVVVDEQDTVVYTQLVAEIADEPDYAAAMKAIS
jgi:thiol peroxidase